MAAIDTSKLPPAWAEPAQELCQKITDCNAEIEWLLDSIHQFEGRIDYWESHRLRLEKQLEDLISGFDSQLFRMDEATIHQLFIDQFSGDFVIEREVWGEYETDIAPKRPRIDFLAYPLPHIIALGFPPVWIGIEAKAPKDDRQAITVIQQAENYRMALFTRKEANIINMRPDMVLIYPPIDFFFQSPGDAKTLKMHAHKSRVGSIRFEQKTNYRPPRWSIKFADDTAYFYSDTGLSNGGAVLNNTYLGNGRVK